MSNQYVPAGSYQLTSRDVQITINASCEQTGGNLVQSPPLTFTLAEAASIGDIANMEGTLTRQPGNEGTPNPTNNYGQFVPAGSYQRTSSNITITINASCEQTGGNWVESPPLTFTAEAGKSLRDISNREGTLQLHQ